MQAWNAPGYSLTTQALSPPASSGSWSRLAGPGLRWRWVGQNVSLARLSEHRCPSSQLPRPARTSETALITPFPELSAATCRYVLNRIGRKVGALHVKHSSLVCLSLDKTMLVLVLRPCSFSRCMCRTWRVRGKESSCDELWGDRHRQGTSICSR